MKKLISWLFGFLRDQTIYQVRSENKTYWITRDEWIRNQRISPFGTLRVFQTDNKETIYGNNNQAQQQPEFYRFQVFQGKRNSQGKIERSKTVGMSYHKPGQENYTLRLWTLIQERFYLLPDQKRAGRYFIMTREPNKNPKAKNKFFWNIVGNGNVDSANGVVELEFDLFERTVYMNIFPEAQAHSVSFADFETELAAA